MKKNLNQIVNNILEGASIREAMMHATIKDPATGKYADVEFEDPWNKDGNSFEFDYAILLSTKEYESYKSEIFSINGYWWLRSVAQDLLVCGVDDIVDDVGEYLPDDDYLGVRPALHIKSFDNFKVGDKLEISGYTFTIISKDYALCDSCIKNRMPFRDVPGFAEKYDDYIYDRLPEEEFLEYCDSIHVNDYKYSDVKKYIDSWFNREIKGKPVGHVI